MYSEAFDPTLFNRLPSIAAARGFLDAKQDLLVPLGKVIEKHGLSHDVRIALLHRHLELNDRERLLEFLPSEGRAIMVRPCVDTPGMPHQFGLVSGNAWSPLEFVHSPRSEVVERVHRVMSHEAFLRDLAEALNAAGAAHVFGFSIEHGRDDLLREDEVFTEDTIGRVSSMVPIPRSVTSPHPTTPTSWKWDGKRPLMACNCVAQPHNGHHHFDYN